MPNEQVTGEGGEEFLSNSVEAGTEGSVESPAEKVEVDKGKDRVAELEAEIGKVKKSYDDLRPEYTRTTQENAKMREELARVSGQLELLTSQQQRGVSPEVAAAEQEQFLKTWREKITENPADAVDFYRGAVGEVQSNLRSELSRTKDELRNELKALREQLDSSDPFYTANKADVDKLISEAGLDRKTALKVVQSMKGTNGKAAQPGRPGAPGTVNSAGTGETKVRGKPVPIDATTLKVMRGMGLDDKTIQKLAVEAGEGVA